MTGKPLNFKSMNTVILILPLKASGATFKKHSSTSAEFKAVKLCNEDNRPSKHLSGVSMPTNQSKDSHRDFDLDMFTIVELMNCWFL